VSGFDRCLTNELTSSDRSTTFEKQTQVPPPPPEKKKRFLDIIVDRSLGLVTIQYSTSTRSDDGDDDDAETVSNTLGTRIVCSPVYSKVQYSTVQWTRLVSQLVKRNGQTGG